MKQACLRGVRLARPEGVPGISSGRSGSSHKQAKLDFRLRPPLLPLPPLGEKRRVEAAGRSFAFFAQGLSPGGGVAGCHQGERRRGAGLIASFLLSVNFHSEGSSQCLPFRSRVPSCVLFLCPGSRLEYEGVSSGDRGLLYRPFKREIT